MLVREPQKHESNNGYDNIDWKDQPNENEQIQFRIVHLAARLAISGTPEREGRLAKAAAWQRRNARYDMVFTIFAVPLSVTALLLHLIIKT
jgi:hypothetical protein